MIDHERESQIDSAKPNILFAPGCFGSAILYSAIDENCRICAFFDRCGPMHLQSNIILQALLAPEVPSSAALLAGVNPDLKQFVQNRRTKIAIQKQVRNEKDRGDYQAKKQNVGQTVGAYRKAPDMTAAEREEHDKMLNRQYVAAHRSRKKAEAEATKAKTAPK